MRHALLRRHGRAVLLIAHGAVRGSLAGYPPPPSLPQHAPCADRPAAVLHAEHASRRSPLTVRKDCSAARAHQVFVNLGLRHLLVVDVHNHVVGMVTRKDLDHAAGHGWWRMSHNPTGSQQAQKELGRFAKGLTAVSGLHACMPAPLRPRPRPRWRAHACIDHAAARQGAFPVLVHPHGLASLYVLTCLLSKQGLGRPGQRGVFAHWHTHISMRPQASSAPKAQPAAHWRVHACRWAWALCWPAAATTATAGTAAMAAATATRTRNRARRRTARPPMATAARGTEGT